MICDTTFLSDLIHERELGRRGPAAQFLTANRRLPFYTTVISVGEIGAMYDSTEEARLLLARYRQFRLTPEIALVAAAVDHELIQTGGRLGENDNWIAGFCRYYGQPLISRDAAFDRVRGLRRLRY
jgi:predicted nucleic acid-binding protein